LFARHCSLACTFAALASVFIAAGCARQYHKGIGDGAEDRFANPFLISPAGPAEFKGSGEIKIYQAKQKASGKIDVRYKQGGRISAQVYSPFGAAVASVEADGSKGVFKSGAEHIVFTYDSPMDAVPFPCARNFTYGEFIKIIFGGTPGILRRLPLSPDSVAERKNVLVASWRGDRAAVRMNASRKTGALLSVSVDYGSIPEEAASLTLSGFKDGIAREITLTDADGSYISIKYETIKIVSE
jgi:hypothetical protein